MTQTPKVADLGWISGHWRGEMYGGHWEEVWSSATENAIQAHGRLIVDGKTNFMEFMSIEADVDGKPVLYMILGAPSKGVKEPKPFPFRESGEKRVKFGREGEDFPQLIEYQRSGDNLTCTLTGTENGEKKSETFAFKKK